MYITELQNTLSKTDTTKRRDKSTITVLIVNTLFSVIHVISFVFRQKHQQGFRNTITQFDLICIYRTVHM